MAFRVTKEHARHFEAEGSGGTFKIAKAGLSKARHTEFQAMCRGGVVKKMASGGEVDPPPEAPPKEKVPALPPAAEPAPAAAAPPPRVPRMVPMPGKRSGGDSTLPKEILDPSEDLYIDPGTTKADPARIRLVMDSAAKAWGVAPGDWKGLEVHMGGEIPGESERTGRTLVRKSDGKVAGGRMDVRFDGHGDVAESSLAHEIGHMVLGGDYEHKDPRWRSRKFWAGMSSAVGKDLKGRAPDLEPYRVDWDGYAQGGTVKGQGMDLSKVRLVKDTPEAWHLHDGKAEFRVAKKGVGKALSGRIAQHFADGGDVAPTGDAGLDMTIAPETVTPEAVASLPPPAAAEPAEGGAPGLAYVPAPSGPSAIPSDAEMLASAQGEPAAPAPEASAAAAAAPPAVSVQAAAPKSPEVDAALQQAARALQGAPPEAVPGAVPGIQSEIARAYKHAEAAAQAQADVAKREADAQVISQQQNEANRQALTASWTKTWEGWQQRGDQLRQAVLDQKIDPNHYWNEKGTGGKISAAIGLILGGIGSGLTHGPNAALQVVQNAIDRDLDAQKANLGKTQSLLGFHMQQGHALQASYQLARADMLDAAAAKIQMTATKFAGDKAQAAASGSIAALQKEAAVTRQSVAATGLQMQLQGQQLEQAKIGLAMSRMQMGALSALTSPQGQPGQPGSSASGGVRMDPRAITFLPKELQEKIVRLPDDSYALARSPKDAEEVSKTTEGAAVLRAKLQRYGALAAKHPHGVSSTVDPQDYATAEALRDSILTDINALSGLNRFTETEKGLYSGRVPDLTSKQLRASGHQAKLAELGREIDDKVWSMNRSYLNLPSRPRTLR